jgi:RNA-binding protein YlmH
VEVIGRMADVEARRWGGFERAERVRLALGRAEVLDGPEGAAAGASTPPLLTST